MDQITPVLDQSGTLPSIAGRDAADKVVLWFAKQLDEIGWFINARLWQV